jgi:hypothetical protein
MNRPSDVRAWVERHAPEQQTQIQWFAHRVRYADDRITEAIKRHRPTFTIEEGWHQRLCGVQVIRRGVSLLLHKGGLLDDPERLLQGEGRYLRHIPFADAARPDAVTQVVREAIAHQTDL